MIRIIAIVFAILVASPSLADDAPQCQPLKQFIAEFKTKADSINMRYEMFRMDRSQMLDLIKSMDKFYGQHSPEKYTEGTTGGLLIMSDNGYALIGVLRNEGGADICYSTIVPSDDLVKALDGGGPGVDL